MKVNTYQLFLSSSNKLSEQREVVEDVVDEINDNLGRMFGFHLQLYRWEHHSTPRMGRPQEVIFDESSYKDIDVYIGLIDNYIGLGTQEEFEEAYRSFCVCGKPEIMLFKDVSPIKLSDLDMEQALAAQKFIDKFRNDGDHPGLVKSYDSTQSLEKAVRKALTEFSAKHNLSLLHKERTSSPSFLDRMRESGISNFYVGRNDWLRYRSHPGLSDYLLSATESVAIATYWLAQGSIEGVLDAYKNLVKHGISVKVVTIEPSDDIANVLAADLQEDAETIKTYVSLTLDKLLNLKDKLANAESDLFSVCTSTAIPQAAVIFLDRGTKLGRIQLEMRPYGLPRNRSYSLEISNAEDASLYKLLEESWSKYFADAEEYSHGKD